MARYFGNDIGDASRAEERQQDRSLQLGLANRDYLTRQRQYEDSLTQAEDSNAAQNYFRQAALDEQAQSGDENRADKAASLAEQQYQFDQGLTNAEAERENRRNIADSSINSRLGLMQNKQTDQHGNTILNRIAKGQIQNLEQLRDADAGRSTPDQWNQFMNQLYNVQRAEHDAEQDPIQQAKNANAYLTANESFSAASDDAEKKAAFWSIYTGLSKNRQYAGKLIPDDKNLQFLPATYKKKNPYTDAIEFFNKSTDTDVTSDKPFEYGGGMFGSGSSIVSGMDKIPGQTNRFVLPEPSSSWMDKESSVSPDREAITKFVAPEPEPEPAPAKSRYENVDVMRNLSAVVKQGKYPAIFYTRVNELIAGGKPPDLAKSQAKREFGY